MTVVFRLAPRWKTVERPVRGVFAVEILLFVNARGVRDGRVYARQHLVGRKMFLALMNTD